MFEDHLETGKGVHRRRQHALDEYRLAVEDVDVGVHHLAVDEERHADHLHASEDGVDAAHVRHPGVGMGGGARRIELHGGEDARSVTALDLVGVGRVGQVAGHQGLETGTVRQRRDNSLPVARAAAVSVTGGTRLGMMMARPKPWAE